MDKYELRKILNSVSVGRMIQIVEWDIRELPNAHALGPNTDGWLVRCRFWRPDRDTAKMEEGAGRFWHIEDRATKEQVSRTAFSAVRMLIEHELLEFFRVEGERLFNPHERGTAHGEPNIPTSFATERPVAEGYKCTCSFDSVCNGCYDAGAARVVQRESMTPPGAMIECDVGVHYDHRKPTVCKCFPGRTCRGCQIRRKMARK